MLSQMPIPFKNVLNVVSLKSLEDLTYITNSVPQQDVSWLVGVIVIIKWAALIAAICLFYLTVLPRLKVRHPIIPFIATAVTVIVICVSLTNPFADMDSINVRFSKISGAFSQGDVTYTPSLLKDVPFQNPLRILLSEVPTNVSAPIIEDDQWTFKEFNIAPVLLIFMLLATIVFLTRFNKWATVVVGSLIVATLIGLSDAKILDVIIITAAVALCYYLLRTKIRFLVVYPIALSLLAILDILQPPSNIAFTVFGVVFVLSLIPVFYIVGLFLMSIGAMRETRTKFGMKKKPIKIVEEEAGQYDPLVTSLILSLLFTASIILYGTTMGALGFFVTTVVGLLKR